MSGSAPRRRRHADGERNLGVSVWHELQHDRDAERCEPRQRILSEVRGLGRSDVQRDSGGRERTGTLSAQRLISTLTLANQASADTTYANQIVTGTGSNLSVASNSAVILQYDASATNSNGASGAWRVIGGSGSSGGSGVTVGTYVSFAGSNCTGGGNTCTIRSSSNVSNVVRNGTGDYTINLYCCTIQRQLCLSFGLL